MAVFTYTGNAQSFSFGQSKERDAFAYNESSAIIVGADDYGLLIDSPSYNEDFGDITTPVLFSYQKENYGFLTPNETIIPFGSIGNLTEFADVRLIRNSVGGITFLIQGKAKIFVLPIHVGSGRIRGFGSAAETRIFSQKGSGTLFGFVGSSISKTNTPPESKIRFSFSGGAFQSFSRANYPGTGLFSTFNGAGLSRVIVTKAQTNIFRFSGSAEERNTESYIGSGTLFGFVGHAERVTYSYNESSRVIPDAIDFGLITEVPVNYTPDETIADYADVPISTYANEIVSEFGAYPFDDDYGSINEDPSPSKPWNKIDYGFIRDNETRLPFGLFKFRSDTNIVYTPAFTGSGTLQVRGVVKVFVLPKHIGSGIFDIEGSAGLKASLAHIGFGRLFGFAGSAESIGRKAESTGLFEINGISDNSKSSREIGSGTLFAFISKTESISNTEVTRTTKNLFKITGSSTVQNTYSEVSSGKLFAFSGGVEKVTYDYNESSVVNISSYDYGFVTDAPVNYTPDETIADYADVPISTYANEIVSEFGSYPFDDDYGSINEPIIYPWQRDDYGRIIDVETRLPFGKIKISGGLLTTKIRLNYISSGTLNLEGSSTESRIFGFNGSGTVKSTGTAKIVISLAHVGSGTLFAIGGGQESITQESHIGSGTIKLSGTLGLKNTFDYIGSGRIFAFTGASESTSNTLTTLTTGLFKFLGGAVEKNTESYVGSGSLFAFTGGQESITQEPHIGSGKITLSGNAIEKNTESYVGSGSLFTFVSKTEATSNAPSTTGLFKFFGAGVPAATLSQIGSGIFFIDAHASESITQEPHIGSGKITLSGNAIEKNAESYVGSGRIFAFTGSAESTSNAPSTTGLFKFFGSSPESTAPAPHIGSGRIFAFTGAAESTSSTLTATGLFKFSGSVVEKNTESYSGSGSLFAFTGSSAVFAGALRVEGALFKFSGTSTIRSSLTEVGRGVFNLRQKVSGIDALDKQRYISGLERKTVVPKTDGALFRASGVVTLFFIYGETGSGTITLAGNARTQTKPVHVGTGIVSINGNGEESRTNPHTGSGRLFGFDSSANIAVSKPPVTGALFKFVGFAEEKNTEVYTGSTNTKLSGSANLIFRLKHIGSGKTTIFGSAIEKNTESYSGSGRIFGFTGGAESIGRKLPEFKTLFRISGTATESNVYSHIGTGSLFTFVSKTESTSSVEVKTTLFKFSGSAAETNTETYVGSGIIRFRTKDSILDVNGKPILVSAQESFVSVPPTKTSLFKFGGAAKTERNTNWTTTGTLFGFGGGAERVSFTPAISTTLFDFVGIAQERKSKTYAGSGSIFAFTGSAESLSVVSSTGGLFKITGSAKESVLPATYIGSGSLFAFVSKTESVTFSPPTKTLFKFTGNAVEKNTEAYLGTGRIFGFQSAGVARVVPYDRTQILFRLSGASKEKIEYAGYIGFTQTQFIGVSANRYVEFDSPKPIRIYII